MGMSLERYAQLHPQEEAPAEAIDRIARNYGYAEEQAAKERAAELKRLISSQIEEGAPANVILYSAIEAIGLLSADKAWSKRTIEELDGVYLDADGLARMEDNAALAVDRMREKQREHNDKLLRQVTKQLKAAEEISGALWDIKLALDADTAEAAEITK